jgi:hypothetical protein
MIANLGTFADDFDKARNLYNNKGNCPGGCLANYKNKSALFLKEAKLLRDYFNNSKTLGSNPDYSTSKTQLATIVSNCEMANNDVQNLSDVARNNGGGGDIGPGGLGNKSSTDRDVQYVIDADRSARTEVNNFNRLIAESAHCLKNYNRKDCETGISSMRASLGRVIEYTNDKLRLCRVLGLERNKKEFGVDLQSVTEEQLNDLRKYNQQLEEAIKQPSMMDAVMTGIRGAFGQ